MRKILMVVLVIAAIVGIGVAVGLLAARGPSNSHVAMAETPQPAPTPAPVVTPMQPVISNPPLDIKPIVPTDAVPIVQSSNFDQVATNTTGSDTNWEDKIDEIVGSDEPDTNKVKELYALFPKLPPDGQEEAAQHLSNLVDDDAYGPLGEMLKNDKLSEGVLDELLADVLNRPNSLKLPLLLDLASDPNHAKRDEAKDLLELYLGEDYGTDWNSWGQHMTNWLQQNPD